MAAVQDMALGRPSRPRRAAQVIVIGAGLSGLQAAYDVQRSGATCLVLEARDRVGGRFACGPLAGGHGFDGRRHPRVLQLALDTGLGLERQHADGQDVVEGLGASGADGIPNLGEDDRRSFIRARDNLEGLCQRVDVNRPAQLMPNYGTTSVHELVVSQGGTPLIQSMADAWTLAMFGLSSTRVSALYFLAHCKCAGGLLRALSGLRAGGTPGLRLRGGAHGLCGALAARLAPGTVCLSQEVESIDQRPGNEGVVVSTRSGIVFRCTAVILAASSSLCRTVRFTPELGHDKQWLRDGDTAGFSERMAVVYEEPWWQRRGLSGRALGLRGSVSAVEDTSSDADDGDGRVHALTCVVSGAAGRRLWQASRDERRRGVLRHLEAIFGDDVPPPLDMVELVSSTDLWASSGPTCLAVPAANLRDLERDQWRPEGAVFFAGAETGHVSREHAEGALASGSRAAEGVLSALGPTLEAEPLSRL